MTVLFDLLGTQSMAGYRFHGGAEYCKQVFHRAIQAGIEGFHAIYNPDLDFDSNVLQACHRNNISLIPLSSWSGLSRVLADGGYDTFFSGLPYPYAEVDTLGIRFVMVVHGLRVLEMPYDPTRKLLAEGYVGRFWNTLVEPRRIRHRRAREKVRIWKLLSRAGAEIVTGSRHSKYSMKSFFPKLELENISVFHCPVDDMSNALPESPPSDGGFYLLIGASRWIKNALLICSILDQLISEGLLHVDKILVLGSDDPQKFVKTLKNPDHFEVRGYVARDELASAYRNAYAFIYPSLNEGFGYPPLNSMQFGTPVLASSLSSIPEVCADAALYFDPCSPEEVRNRVLQIDRDEVLYQSLVAKGSRRFSEIVEMEKQMMADMLALIFGPDSSGIGLARNNF